MKLLALDPARKTGFAFFVDGEIQEQGVWKFDAHDHGVAFWLLQQRLQWVENNHESTLVVVEGPSIGSKNAQAAILLAAGWTTIIKAHCARCAWPAPVVVPPQTWWNAVLSRADKKRYYGETDLKKKSALRKSLVVDHVQGRGITVRDHNAADAVAIGLWALGGGVSDLQRKMEANRESKALKRAQRKLKLESA